MHLKQDINEVFSDILNKFIGFSDTKRIQKYHKWVTAWNKKDSDMHRNEPPAINKKSWSKTSFSFYNQRSERRA